MSPTKTAKLSVSFIQANSINPEMRQSQAIKGLNIRTSHVPNYSDVPSSLTKINTELIIEHKNLEAKISYLKEEIAKEKRMTAKA